MSREEELKNLFYFIQEGGDLNKPDYLGKTRLYHAVKNDDLEVCSILLCHGANVNCRDIYQKSLLWNAVSVKVAKVLINYGIDLESRGVNNNTALHHAITERRSPEFIKYLIECGADVNALGMNNMTPLHYAVMAGNTEIVEYLIYKEVNVNALGMDNNTALYFASESGNVDIVIQLLLHGADSNIVNNSQHTPLHIASYKKHQDICGVLITSGAEIQDLAGWNEYLLGPHNGSDEIPSFLLQVVNNMVSLNTLFMTNEYNQFFNLTENGVFVRYAIYKKHFQGLPTFNGFIEFLTQNIDEDQVYSSNVEPEVNHEILALPSKIIEKEVNMLSPGNGVRFLADLNWNVWQEHIIQGAVTPSELFQEDLQQWIYSSKKKVFDDKSLTNLIMQASGIDFTIESNPAVFLGDPPEELLGDVTTS